MTYFEEAARVLLANKVRSLLTIVGLVIGVGAVIAIQVLGNSMAGAVNGALGSLTDNSFVIFPNSRQRDVSKAAITLRDLAAIQGEIPGIIAAVPLGSESELVRAAHSQVRFSLSPDAAVSFDNLPLLYGRRLTAEDIAGAANDSVLTNNAYPVSYTHLDVYKRQFLVYVGDSLMRSTSILIVCRCSSWRWE